MDPRRLAQMQRTFVAPARLAQSRPRAVELTLVGRLLVGVAMLLFAGAIAAGLALYREADRQADNRNALLTTGVFVTGEVTRLWPGNGDNRRRVAYRYIANGETYGGENRVSRERRATLQLGSPLPVRYVPANPRVHDLGGTPRGGLPLWLPFAVALAVAAGGVLCLWILDRQRQLLMNGRVGPAVVLAHDKQQHSHGSHTVLKLEFPLLSGAVRSATRAAPKKPPAVGSVICVVYDPDRPARNMLYPLSLVRPAR